MLLLLLFSSLIQSLKVISREILHTYANICIISVKGQATKNGDQGFIFSVLWAMPGNAYVSQYCAIIARIPPRLLFPLPWTLICCCAVVFVYASKL